jgi:hypothetical protein
LSRHVVVGLFVALLWSTNAIAAPGEPTPAGSAMPAASATPNGADAKCHVGGFYADRDSAGVYRGMIQGDKTPARPENRIELTVLTSHGAWRFPNLHLRRYMAGQELSIPDDGNVRAAWVESEGGPDGPMHHCEPTMAFLVDGYDGIPKTRMERLDQWAGAVLAKRLTHVAIVPGVDLRNGGKAAGDATAVAEPPCAGELGEAIGPFVKAAPGAPGPLIAVNVSPSGQVMTAAIVRSFGSRAADEARLAEALSTSFATPPSTGCLAVPHRALVTTRTP